MHTIYALTEDGTLETVRYVGQTNRFDRIVSRHISQPRPGLPRDLWIKDMRRRGKRPVAVQLGSVLGNELVSRGAECEYIRQWTRYTDGKLLNVDSREKPLTPEEIKADQAAFLEMARWAINRCIEDGLIEQPSTKTGWGRLLDPDNRRRIHGRRAAVAALASITEPTP